MTFKANMVRAWGVFVGTILFVFVADYSVRKPGEDFYYSGLGEGYWMAFLIIATIVAGFFVFQAMRQINNYVYKAVHIVVNIILGFAFYAIASYLYIVGLGIDSV